MEEERLYDVYALDEDIQYLEDLISFARALLITPQKATIQEKEIEAIEHLIEAYRKVKEENNTLKEQLQMFIPRRRVRRVYKMLGKILRTDIDPVLLEKELKSEE